jgi:ubiquinone/menaquinone biosynthesis C-methylase UbiE
MSFTATDRVPECGSDLFRTLDDMPSESVARIGEILDAMATLPTFREARRWVLRQLDIADDASLIEIGCGNGAALPDVLSLMGTNGRVVGIDPTIAFVETARARAAALGATRAEFRVGDIRTIPCATGAFDAAFCDKVLIRTAAPKAALDEMARVTRAGGHIGAVEWLPFFLISSTRPSAADAFNAIFKTAVHDYFVSGNLKRHFHAAGLKRVRTQTFLAHTDNLDTHPWWRAFIVYQMSKVAQVGLIDQSTASAFLADLEALNTRNEFSASFIVTGAVGINPPGD